RWHPPLAHTALRPVGCEYGICFAARYSTVGSSTDRSRSKDGVAGNPDQPAADTGGHHRVGTTRPCAWCTVGGRQYVCLPRAPDPAVVGRRCGGAFHYQIYWWPL